jgi:hypothetical protein
MFRAASLADPDTPAYAQDAVVLRRVIGLRKVAAQPESTPKWERAAVSLHVFYLRNGLHGEAEALDRRALATLQHADAEARLAETLLEAQRPAEVVALLTTEATWTRGAQHGAYHGIALARLGRYAEAVRVADGLKPAADADPLLLRDVARLEGLLGREQPCATLLVRAFQATPAADLPAFKREVQAHPDFARVKPGDVFTRALATKSAQAATGCSGGSDCGSCPSRGGCGKK